MTSREFIEESLNKLRKEVRLKNIEEALLPFKIIAWKKLSEKGKIKEELSFDTVLTKYPNTIKEKLKELVQFVVDNEKLPQIFSKEDINFIDKLSKELLQYLISGAHKLEDYPEVAEYLPDIALNTLKGEYILPQELINTLIDLVKVDGNVFKSVYNPYPGIYRAAYYINKELKIAVETEDPKKTSIPYLMNVLNNSEIHPHFSDPLTNPSLVQGLKLLEFDLSISLPPFNQKGIIKHDKYGRFKITKEGKGFLDAPIIEHIFSQTKEKAFIFTSMSFLTRTTSIDKELKKWLTEKGYIEAVISFPENILLNTALSISLLILNKNKQDKNILFIDASNLYERASKGRKNILKNIEKIIKVYKERKEIEGFSYLADEKEIAENDYMLNPDIYVLTKEEKEIKNQLSKFELIPLEEIAQIINSPLTKREEGEVEIYEIQASDIGEEGFVEKADKIAKVKLSSKDIEKSSIKKGDILLVTKGNVGKVGIVVNKPENQIWIPGQSITITRAKNKELAPALFMFLKSNIGQYLLNRIKVGRLMESISIKSLKELKVPKFTNKQIKKLNELFKEEYETYKEIEEQRKKIKQLNENLINELF